MINTDIHILDVNQKLVGALHVKIYWKDYKEPYKTRMEDAEMTKIWEHKVSERIANALKEKELNLAQAFNIIDRTNN